MSSYRDLYPGEATLAGSLPGAGEISLRAELDTLLLGSSGETPRGVPVILRKARRDSSGRLVSCTCLSELTREADRDYPCSLCDGRGYLWDELLTTAYKVTESVPDGSSGSRNLPKTVVGAMSLPAARFYLRYSVGITTADRIVEPELSADGRVIRPYNRLNFYEINLVRALRGDNARVEYYICHCQLLGPKTRGRVG